MAMLNVDGAGGDVHVFTGPQLVAKVTDLVGVHLARPDNAIVLCVDEKSQIAALDRTAPVLAGCARSCGGLPAGSARGEQGRDGTHYLLEVCHRVLFGINHPVVHDGLARPSQG